MQPGRPLLGLPSSQLTASIYPRFTARPYGVGKEAAAMPHEVQRLEFTMFGVRVKAQGRLAVWLGGGIAVAVAGLAVVMSVLGPPG